MEITFLLILGAGIFLYFLPTIIGYHKRNALAIFVVNFFLGWTFVGWIIAFVWALAADSEKNVVNIYQNSDDLNLLERMRASGKITNDEYWEERKRMNK